MSKWIRENLNKDEGFTLVELMVVVLIIAILIAIAIPTFLGARERAQDRAMQSNLRNGLTAEKVHYTDAEEFVNDAAGDITAIEPSLTFQDGALAAASVNGDVHLIWSNAGVNQEQIICLEGRSQSGTSFAIMDIATGNAAGTYYNSDATNGATLGCHADPDAVPGGTWVQGGW